MAFSTGSWVPASLHSARRVSRSKLPVASAHAGTHDRPAFEVDHRGGRSGELSDVGAGTDGRELPAADGDRLRHRELGVDGDDMTVDDDGVRRRRHLG